MSQVMIDEMSKLPYDIAIDKPIPSHCSLKRGIFLKNTNADSYHGNTDESADKTIKNINQKGGLVNFSLWLFMNHTHYKFQ